ncbi:peptide/nickel transport system ATP-binding protein [Rhizobiales bacterium GAS191]|nr:peptide/nickel transport system ATP-binding protein [Rhizobiales bacterium GAS191]
MSLLELADVTKAYRARRGLFAPQASVLAVAGVSLKLERGRTLGLVGESGCGKSTTGRLALGLESPDSGKVRFDDAPLPTQDSAAWRRLRARMQLVFQDPLGALDRRLPIGAQIAEPLAVHAMGGRAEHRTRTAELLRAVGLRADQAASYPHELSGGQRQRAVLARALATSPDLLVCDEPVSALDVSIQAQVVNLLGDLQAKLGLAMLFISHDLKLVRFLAHEVAVMYLGLIVERGEPDALYAAPAHPYTRALLAAVPGPRQRGPRLLLQGEPPNPASRPTGCAFHPRCPLAVALCKESAPALQARPDGRLVACHVAHDDGSVATQKAA